MVKWKKRVKHDTILQAWHMDDKTPESREWKLLYGLSEESDFNDVFVDSFVTDDTKLLCFSLGK